jgi:pimeloyl-ACP methyl ester carboxylesterase
MGRIFRVVLVCALLMPFGVSRPFAQVSPQVSIEDVDLGDGALGRYRAPAGGASPIAFLAIHRTNDFRNHQSAVELANRGFGTLGIRTRFGSEADVNFELIALDIRNGIRYLKTVKKHTRVILVGRSGGGPSTSYYQALAENGVAYCKGPNKITECPFTGAEFTPADRADGIVYTDAHPGVSVNQLRSLNGSVVVQGPASGPAIDPALDPFDPNNGYNASGNSVYSAAFVDAYARAQSRRMNDLIREAQQIKQNLPPGSKDAPFIIKRSSARLVELSTDVQCCTLKPTRLLLDATGTLSPPQIIRSVRVPSPGIRDDDATGSETLTLTSFLSANAIRSRHSLDDIDWCSSNNSTVCAVRSISVPTLVLAHQGHYFIRDGEEIYEAAKSADKEFIVVEGATHAGGNCTACATYHHTGPYVNVLRNTRNYVATWAKARF